jgi:hypothetical protein
MADYNYGGSEEENAELKKLETELVRRPVFVVCVAPAYRCV